MQTPQIPSNPPNTLPIHPAQKNLTNKKLVEENVERVLLWVTKLSAILVSSILACEAVLPHLRFTQHLTKPQRLALAFRAFSTTHAILGGVSSVQLVFQKQTWATDVFTPFPEQLVNQFAMTCAFSVVDMVRMAASGERQASLWLHHVMECYGMFLMICYRYMAWFPMAFCLPFWTDPVTTFATTVEILGKQGSRLHLNALRMRALAFVVMRLFLGPWSVWRAVKCHGWKQFLQELKDMPRPLSVGSAVNVFFVGCMNVLWTRQAVKRALAFKVQG